MKITVKIDNSQLVFRDLYAGDCFFFIEDMVVNKKDPCIKTDEGDCVVLSNGVYIRRDKIDGDCPVQKAKAELIIE